MIFIKFNNIPLLLLFLFVAGCSTLENLPLNKAAESVDSSDVVNEEVVTEEEVIPPNPYYESQKSVSREVRQQFSLAADLMEKELWSDAQASLEPMALENPKLSGIWLNLGITHLQQGNNAEAVKAFKNAVESNPLNIAAHNRLAYFYKESGEFAAAESQYQQALSVWDYDVETHKNLGILYDLYMNKPQLALNHYKRAQALNETEDRQLKGWIIDIERRMPKESL